MLTPNPLKPNAFEQTIIDDLSNHLKHLMQSQGGYITFHDFMQAALYTPDLGYYMNHKPKIGKNGDFTTAPEISPLFGQCLANQIQPILSSFTKRHIIEFGAGTGRLAATILAELEKQKTLPDYYYIIELSASLKAEQKATLEAFCPHLLSRVIWLNSLPTLYEAVVIANEVLDAMPFHLCQIQSEADKVAEYHIGYEAGQWHWSLATPSSDRLKTKIQGIRRDFLSILSMPSYTTEINLYLEPWLHSISSSLTRACMILCDYGFPAHEYYHPDRHQGTLMCHYQHHCHSNPLMLVGVQDITAHVDFTMVANAALASGFSVDGFTTLAYFLLGANIHHLISEETRHTNDYEQKQAIMQLTCPSEMGELFKVMLLTKNLDQSLTAFTLKDMRYRL